MSEGGLSILGRRLSIGTFAGGFTMTDANTKYILCRFRVNSAHSTMMVRPSYIYCTYPDSGAVKMVKIELQHHNTNNSIGVISGSPSLDTTYNNSTLNAFIVSNALTIAINGYILHTEIISNNTSTEFNFIRFRPHLSRFLATSYDTVYLIALGSSSSMTIVGSMDVFKIF